MRFQATVHSLGLLLIAPSILIINRLPNRARSKRVTILKNLMYWLIINGVFWVIKSATLLGNVWRVDPPPRFMNRTRYEKKTISSTGALNKSLIRRSLDNQLHPSRTSLEGKLSDFETKLDQIADFFARGRYDKLPEASGKSDILINEQLISKPAGRTKLDSNNQNDALRASRCRRDIDRREWLKPNAKWVTLLCWFHGLIMRLVSYAGN